MRFRIQEVLLQYFYERHSLLRVTLCTVRRELFKPSSYHLITTLEETLCLTMSNHELEERQPLASNMACIICGLRGPWCCLTYDSHTRITCSQRSRRPSLRTERPARQRLGIEGERGRARHKRCSRYSVFIWTLRYQKHSVLGCRPYGHPTAEQASAPRPVSAPRRADAKLSDARLWLQTSVRGTRLAKWEILWQNYKKRHS